MKTTGNTILITGGGTGIGRGLAEAFHALDNQVVISGRTQKSLDETTSANPGMKSLTVDMTDPVNIKDFAARLAGEFPALNVVINNAGIMKPEKVLEPQDDCSDAETMITTNLLGPIRLTAALLPLLNQQPEATLMTVSSGLAFMPLAMTPTYCATKAAIHSYSQSLRYQLKSTRIKVVELVPPYVATSLMGERQANDSKAMPLDEFIAEVMDLIKTHPDATEICVKRVHPLRFSAEGGREKYQQAFQSFNDTMAAERQ